MFTCIYLLTHISSLQIISVDSSPHPKSNLNPNLESLETLAKRYDCPIFSSLTELLQDAIGQTMDGAIVCTPHSTHFNIGKKLIEEGQYRYEEATKKQKDDNRDDKLQYRPINILMEKPMTTNVREAKELYELLMARQKVEDTTKESASFIGGGVGCFLINHSANYRPQARTAKEIISSGKLGTIRHVTAFFASPLMWIFEDPTNKGWNEPTGEMKGNGFAWGQQSHLLSWLYHVMGNELVPKKVYCSMTCSEKTGADISHAATITCENGATFSLSGTSLLPGYEHSDPPVAKRIQIKIFGTKGALIFSGNDTDSKSGRLEYLPGNDDGEKAGTIEVQCPELGFEFEELDQTGSGPESMQVGYFI